MARAAQDLKKVLDNVAGTANGAPMLVIDYRHIELALDTANSASMTIKVQGSIQATKPDFSSAQSATNQWSYIQLIDLADQSTIAGATGVVLTGTDAHRLFEVNTNGLVWVSAVVTAYSAGNATVQVMPVNDAAV